MNAMPPRPRGRRDRGSVSLLVVVMIPALVAAAGLVLDGGRQLTARREAAGAAQSAARAAVQAGPDEVLAGALDPGRAIGRARSELARLGATGGVEAVAGRIVVTVVASVDYAILPGGASIRETATAVGVKGVDGSAP